VIEGRTPAEPGPGEVRVRVTECGICGSDLKMYAGDHPVHRPPLLLGHELIGTIDATGPGVGLAAGTDVVVYPAIGCGHCYACRRGDEQLCSDMQLIGGHRDGGLSDFVLMPERNAMPIGEGVPADHRVLVEPLAVAVHAVNRAALDASDSALVVGAGPIGMFVAIVLRAGSKRRIVLVDRDPARLKMASRFGFETALSSEGDSFLAGIGQEEGFEAVFDCAGGPDTPDRAVRSTTPGGTVVLVGVPPETISLDTIALQRAERALLGSMMYTREEFVRAMELLANDALGGSTIPAELVRLDFSLDDVSDAFATLAEGRSPALKIVLRTARS
jgi:L-iditol 2-dehydrogenase